MKKLIFVFAFSILGLVPITTKAQVRVGVNFNFTTQPIWGPEGNDYVNYYYLPDIDVFYNVPKHQYVYVKNGRWTFSRYLPYQYRNYNLYNGYKVVINEDRPYRNATMYRTKYATYKGNSHTQINIRNSRDTRYYENRNHPEHANWAREHRPQRKNIPAKKTNKNKGRRQ